MPFGTRHIKRRSNNVMLLSFLLICESGGVRDGRQAETVLNRITHARVFTARL